MALLVSIDNGGTLTDVCGFDGDRIYHAKTLTTPHDLTECLINGLKALAVQIYGEEDLPRIVASIDHLRYSTTQGTNAIVQRKGPRLGLLADDPLLADSLRAQAPDLFDQLVGARVALVDQQTATDRHALARIVTDLVARGANRIVVAMSGSADAERDVKRLLYSAFPRHLLGAVPLLFSTELTALGNPVRRSWSALLNAFLHPSMERFLYGAEERLRALRNRNPLLVFRNDGNSTRVAKTVALKTYSSGPRGGVLGASRLCEHYQIDQAVSIDIGGTTTDIALFERYACAEHLLGQIESAPVSIPLADVRSIGAGGSSIIRVRDGIVCVGPESVGSAPGPACFGRGGTLPTVTDAALAAGLFDPASYFSGRLPLDPERARRALGEHVAAPLGVSLDVAIKRSLDAYHCQIAAAIRQCGDLRPDACLIAFGGAGPMSACEIADLAGISRVLIPRYAAVFSAFGIGFSDIQHTYTYPVAQLTPDSIADAKRALREQARRGMQAEGFEAEGCRLRWSLLRERDGGVARSPLPDHDVSSPDSGGWIELEITRPIPKPALNSAARPAPRAAVSTATRQMGRSLPLFRLESLQPGEYGDGPCLIEEAYFTAQAPAGWRFEVTSNRDLLLAPV
ncbi:MAG TPA: hydantoinase/oxoprolinase family protein [Steroidobacter sp.]|uniref:hydantoinase/oxoprolinase family protein n=1 Tax=Steroidobacter sp. TaxID=1978227 RepID=UPI002EDA03A3